MDNNQRLVRRFLKGLLVLGVMVIIALLVGLFFAFGGDNPILIHVANVIDMMLVMITVLFVMGMVYVLYMFATGNGQALKRSPKKPKTQHGDIPELSQLIDNLDATD